MQADIQANIQDIPTKELVATFNNLAAPLGVRTVKKFSDRKTAIRRIMDLMRQAPNPSKTTTLIKRKKSVKTDGARSTRVNFLGMRTDIRASAGITPLKQKNSVRATALTRLIAGATQKDLEHIFAEADKRRGVTGKDTLRRAYEMIRIFCYHYGYGTKSSTDGNVIWLVTE